MNKDFQTPKGTIYIRRLEKHNPDRNDIRLDIEKLLQEKLDNQDLKISNQPNGKPFLPRHENVEISISHTTDTFAVYVSKEAVGIDIEYESQSIQKAKSRFMNAAELEIFPLPSSQELHLIWGAKEAIYKHYEGNFLSLPDQVTIRKIDSQYSVIHAKSPYGETQCFYEIDSGLYVVWT